MVASGCCSSARRPFQTIRILPPPSTRELVFDIASPGCDVCATNPMKAIERLLKRSRHFGSHHYVGGVAQVLSPTGVLTFNVHLPGLMRRPVTSTLERVLRASTVVSNDFHVRGR